MKKQVINLQPGAKVTGKWNGKTYTIIRELGSGACGTVFLCRNENGRKYALKAGEDSSRMMMEVNMLKKFSKVQGVKLGPSFVDVDDWTRIGGKAMPFYVMEYIDGIPLEQFLKGKTKDWIGICTLQLLSDLDHLHQAGYVFGDLKTDNLLMSASKVRWIDVGGVTALGRAIKEYTEFYDRGYWGMGSRRAEPSYDLFAVTMIMMEMAYPKRFERGSSPKKTLENKLQQADLLKPYRRFIQDCWRGRYINSREMKQALSGVLMSSKKAQNNQTRYVRRKKEDMETKEWTVFSLVSALLFGVSIISFFI
ncbi:protein kinase [Halobacillus sp. ACCC02827]|uniref:serine/threonine protein kinase n=1 Tax=Halobacillus sp. ACCC02827 TaxID=3052090 RepID=UPI00256FBB3D|nr:protein kinase [Halobacillus sp. ACCC02827]WJE15899.1 protein kinase [Halobacillus sp. ACCC02827]